MSGHSIRIGSAVEHEHTGTDWAKLRALSDAEIDTAIAEDVGAYPLEAETLGRVESAYHYQIFRDGKGYRWRLISAQGDVLANSPEAFLSKSAVTKAIAGLRAAILGGDSLAA